MSSPLETLVNNTLEAIRRIRALMFVSLGLCVIVLSNAYLENFSLDKEMLMLSNVFEETYHKKLIEKKEEIKNADELESERLSIEISKLIARIKRIDNSLNDFKLRSVSIPFTGVNVPANDLTIVCGIFLLMLSIWIVFSVNQVNSVFFDEILKDQLNDYVPSFRHAVMFILPPDKKLLRFFAFLLLAAPAITMTLATLSDIQSIVAFEHQKLLSNLFRSLTIRLVFLTTISVLLWFSAIVCLKSWKEFSQSMYDN